MNAVLTRYVRLRNCELAAERSLRTTPILDSTNLLSMRSPKMFGATGAFNAAPRESYAFLSRHRPRWTKRQRDSCGSLTTRAVGTPSSNAFACFSVRAMSAASRVFRAFASRLRFTPGPRSRGIASIASAGARMSVYFRMPANIVSA
jgi:hypothetical protein